MGRLVNEGAVSTIATSDGGSGARRSVIATAGHVDHGKTALVRALTGVDTDRLAEEKRRGITLELGFAELPSSAVSLIDVPGHRRLVHAMIAGASGVGAILLAVAADDGVMPQTREHLRVAELLGVRPVIVAITKTDLADEATVSLAEDEARRTVSEMGLELAAVVRTSAHTGAGVSDLDAQIRRVADALPSPPESARAVVAIDRVFTVRGAGLVVTGTLVRGWLRAGQSMYVHGRRGTLEAVCRGLENHGRGVDRLDAPARIAVNVGRLDKDDVARGSVLSSHADVPITRRLDVSLRCAPSVTVADGSPAVLHCGTARAAARVAPFDGFAQITLAEPIAVLGGTAFVLRGFSDRAGDAAVLGGGCVLDAIAPPLPRRRDRVGRARRAVALEHCLRGRFAEAATVMMDDASRPLDGTVLEGRLGIEPGTLESLLGDTRCIVPLGGRTFTTERVLTRFSDLAIARVEAHQANAPHERGVSLETVRAALTPLAGAEAADAALRRAIAARRLVSVDRRLLATPDFVERRHPVSDDTASTVLEALERASFQGLDEGACVSGATPLAAARVALARLAADGRARRLGSLWFAERALDETRRRVRQHFARGLALSVPDFKALCGVSRKQAILLLEQLDREGTTLRAREKREKREKREEEEDVRLAGPRLRE